MLDEGTYGNSPAAITLVKIINEKNLSHRELGRLLTTFNVVLRELKKLDSRIGLGLAKTVYKNYCEKADKLPEEIISYSRNLLAAKYKIWVEERNGQRPYKFRYDNPNNCIHKN